MQKARSAIYGHCELGALCERCAKSTVGTTPTKRTKNGCPARPSAAPPDVRQPRRVDAEVLDLYGPVADVAHLGGGDHAAVPFAPGVYEKLDVREGVVQRPGAAPRLKKADPAFGEG